MARGVLLGPSNGANTMSAKPISFVLVASLALLAGRGLSNAAPRTAPASNPATPAAAAPTTHADAVPASAPILSSFDPAKAFVSLGCSGCHGDDGIYRDEIKGAIGKPVDQVARWIRNAPSIKPDTDMPNFEKLIDVPNSVALAGWVMDRAGHLD
jgi:mono/diheme cytochrome c family protein